MASAKTKRARKMLTHWEIKNHVPVFQSAAWMKRAAAIRARVTGFTAPKPEKLKIQTKWYEGWVMPYILHSRGVKLPLWQYVMMQTLRMIHFVFFRKSVNKDVMIKAPRKYSGSALEA